MTNGLEWGKGGGGGVLNHESIGNQSNRVQLHVCAV